MKKHEVYSYIYELEERKRKFREASSRKMRELYCELAMCGCAVEVKSRGDLVLMVNYIIRELKDNPLPDGISLLKPVLKDGYDVKYLSCTTVQGMRCINLCLETEDLPKPFEEDYGSGYPCSFCYVLNLDAPEFSEFGDCFFEMRDGYYHRIS